MCGSEFEDTGVRMRCDLCGYSIHRGDIGDQEPYPFPDVEDDGEYGEE